VVVIRCTQKLLRRLRAPEVSEASSTTRLGDWTANVFGIRRQRYVLLVSERSRLPVVLPARDVQHVAALLEGVDRVLAGRLAGAVGDAHRDSPQVVVDLDDLDLTLEPVEGAPPWSRRA
jgi:hypothetical protein